MEKGSYLLQTYKTERKDYEFEAKLPFNAIRRRSIPFDRVASNVEWRLQASTISVEWRRMASNARSCSLRFFFHLVEGTPIDRVLKGIKKPVIYNVACLKF